MSDAFEHRLRVRLERLESAVPPLTMPIAPSSTARPARRRRGRMIVLLAAALLLTAASAVAASRLLFPDEPQPAVEAALEDIFGAGACLSAGDARATVRDRLDGLGYANWGIESRPGADQARCVYAGYLSPERVVLLFPHPGGDVVQALQPVWDAMLERCIGRAEARELISSVLASFGITEFRIRTDGPRAAPIGRSGEYAARAAAGCHLYSSMGSDEDGTTTIHLWGP
jgi:hypothetical protein